MSNFEFSNIVDKDNVFTTNISEIEDRLDPIYYKLRKNLIATPHLSFAKVGHSFFIKDGDHDKLPTTAISNSRVGRRYLRAQDLKDNNIISDKPVYVSEEYFKMVKRCHILPNDLLFSIMASVGATAIVPEDFPACTANRAVGILRMKENAVLKAEYVQVLLNTEFGLRLLELNKRGGIQQRVNLSDIYELKLPLFDFETQDKIVDLYNTAKQTKSQKQTQAKELLKSIDSYLLNELGISLPEKDNSLKNRIFTTTLGQVSRRLDPDYISKIDYITSLKWNYKTNKLGNLIKVSPQYGANESACEYRSKNDIRYIRITDIDEYGNLKIESKKTAEKIQDKYLLEDDDILFARSGSVGRCYIHKHVKEDAIFAGYLIRFKLDTLMVNPDFLFYYCHSSIYKFWVSAIERPAVQSNINSEEFKSLEIPIPPLDKQIEIANNITDIRNQAKQLEFEAELVMQEAKSQIEKIILSK